MLIKNQSILMDQYNEWMNKKIYAVCSQIPDRERKQDLDFFFKSIHSTLNHLLYGDKAWMPQLEVPGNL